SVAVDPVPIKGCTKTARVPDGIITCLDFATANGCSVDNLVAWNTNLSGDCSNLNSGLQICVSVTPIKSSVVSTTVVRTTVTTATTAPQTTSITTGLPVITTTAVPSTAINTSVSTSNTAPTSTQTSGGAVLATSVILIINFTKYLVKNVRANRHVIHSNKFIKTDYTYFNQQEDSKSQVKFISDRQESYSQLANLVCNVQKSTNNSNALEPQLFHGARDVYVSRDWLVGLERYCIRSGLPKEQWTSVAANRLRSAAQSWFLKSNIKEDAVWEIFKAEFLREFKPSNHERSIMRELRVMRQSNPRDLPMYVNRFRDLAYQLDHPSDNILRDYFISGLDIQTQVLVEIANPQTWRNAIQAAEKIDEAFARVQPNQGMKKYPEIIYTPTITQISRLYSHAQINHPFYSAHSPIRRLEKLSPCEREHLRRIGGCFRCRRVGHRASNCGTKPKMTKTSTDVCDEDKGKERGELFSSSHDHQITHFPSIRAISPHSPIHNRNYQQQQRQQQQRQQHPNDLIPSPYSSANINIHQHQLSPILDNLNGDLVGINKTKTNVINSTFFRSGDIPPNHDSLLYLSTLPRQHFVSLNHHKPEFIARLQNDCITNVITILHEKRHLLTAR
ncbi:hypothetical protein BGZ76_006052, partial [Entomortierella beljakovae]